MEQGIRSVNFMGLLTNGISSVRIPAYQRGYDWHDIYWDGIYQDIFDIYKRGGSREQHFMSTVLMSRHQENVDLVDGQQRITTISIFIAALQYVLNSYGIKDQRIITDLEKGILVNNEASRDSVKKVNLLKFKNTVDNNSYSKIINISYGVKVNEDFEILRIDQLDEDFLIEKAFIYFIDKINATIDENYTRDTDLHIDWISEFIYGMFNKTITNLEFVKIETEDGRSPQKIFESTNGYGKSLSLFDMCKSYVLMNAENTDSADRLYKNDWAKFNELMSSSIISSDDIESFLRYWMRSKKNINMTKRVKDKISNYNNFKIVAKDFKNIEDLSHSLSYSIFELYKLDKAGDRDSKVKVSSNYDGLQSLYDIVFRTTAGRSMRTIIVSCIELIRRIELQYGKEKALEYDSKIFVIVENYLVRQIFSTGRFAGETVDFVKDAIDVSSKYLFSDKSYTEKIQDWELSMSRSFFHNGTYKKNNSRTVGWGWHKNSSIGIEKFKTKDMNLAKPILAKIEDYLIYQKKSLVKNPIDKFSYTVEHFMPKNPRINDWPLASEVSRDYYISSIGNMTLASGHLNSALNNGSLESKLSKINAIVTKHELHDGTMKYDTGINILDSLLESVKIDKTTGLELRFWGELEIESNAKYLYKLLFEKIYPDIEYFIADSEEITSNDDTGSFLVYSNKRMEVFAKKMLDGKLEVIKAQFLSYKDYEDFLTEFNHLEEKIINSSTSIEYVWDNSNTQQKIIGSKTPLLKLFGERGKSDKWIRCWDKSTVEMLHKICESNTSQIQDNM